MLKLARSIGCCDDGNLALGAISPIDAGLKESKAEILKPCGDSGVSLGNKVHQWNYRLI